MSEPHDTGNLVRVSSYGNETHVRTESVTDPDDWLELRLPGARADLAAKLIEALKAVVEEPNDDNVIRLPVEPELDSTTRIGGLRCRDGEELEIHVAGSSSPCSTSRPKGLGPNHVSAISTWT